MQWIVEFWNQFFVIREGRANRVIFYFGEEPPTYLDDTYVRMYRNGTVEIFHNKEEVSTHVQNVEILWRMQNGIGQRNLTLIKTDAQK